MSSMRIIDNIYQEPWRRLLCVAPNSLEPRSWAVRDAIRLRNTCKTFYLHGNVMFLREVLRAQHVRMTATTELRFNDLMAICTALEDIHAFKSHQLFSSETTSVFMAGSYPLYKYLQRHFDRQIDWVPNDWDVFVYEQDARRVRVRVRLTYLSVEAILNL